MAQALGPAFGRACSVSRGSRGILDRTRDSVRSAACPSQAWGLGDKTATNPTPPACRQTCRAERRPSSKRYSITHSGRWPGAPPALQLRREPAGANTHVQNESASGSPSVTPLRVAPPPPASRGEETEGDPSPPHNGGRGGEETMKVGGKKRQGARGSVVSRRETQVDSDEDEDHHSQEENYYDV